jgi:arylformamidase
LDDEIVYNGMTRPQLDAAYNNRAHATSWPECFDHWRQASAQLYASHPVARDLRYGPRPRQRMDFFPAKARNRPTLFYIHGGYWQWVAKEEEAFIAHGPLAHDINVALVDYTLCPDVGMGDIVAEVGDALNWLVPRLAQRGAAADQIIVGGSSAGAHLAATLLGHPSVRAALLVSGVYDLEPIRLSWVNDAIGMDAETARRHSPLLHAPSRSIPVCLAVGADELPEMMCQTRAYHTALALRRLPSRLLVVPDTDHFSVLDQLAAPEGSLTTALLEVCQALSE